MTAQKITTNPAGIPPDCQNGDNLRDVTLQMMNLVSIQLSLCVLMLTDENQYHAKKIIYKNRQVGQIISDINTAGICVISEDLATTHLILSLLKIQAEVDAISNETCNIACLFLTLFEPKVISKGVEIPANIIDLGRCVEQRFKRVIRALGERTIIDTQVLLQQQDCVESCLQDSIETQFYFATRHTAMIGRTLNLLAMIDALSHCVDHCNDIAQEISRLIEK